MNGKRGTFSAAILVLVVLASFALAQQRPVASADPVAAGPDSDRAALPALPEASADAEYSPAWWSAVAEKLRETDPAGLQAFLANNAHRAFFNVEWGAIQIAGCGGELIASIPLRSEQVAGLLEQAGLSGDL